MYIYNIFIYLFLKNFIKLLLYTAMDIKYTLFHSKYNNWSVKKANDIKAIYLFKREKINEANTQNFKKVNWRKFLYSENTISCPCCRGYDITQKEKDMEKRKMMKTLKEIKENKIFLE